MGADAKKYKHIWEMNEEECKQLARLILEADRIIHEQQLGLPWSPPPLYVFALHLPFIDKPLSDSK